MTRPQPGAHVAIDGGDHVRGQRPPQALFARAAVRGGYLNVKINASGLQDQSVAAELIDAANADAVADAIADVWVVNDE